MGPSLAPPPSLRGRCFPPPANAFETEIAVTLAGNARMPSSDRHAVWVATREDPRLARFVFVRRGADVGDVARSIARERLIGLALTVAVDARSDAEALAGLVPTTRREAAFYVLPTALALRARRADALKLDPAVGDASWNAWASVERRVFAGRAVSEAAIDRSVAFKRSQQRGTPPIRRFVGRDPRGEAIAMIGYAPFAECDLGVGHPGPLARLRDVAVVPDARREGYGAALIGAVAEAAFHEHGATQLLIAAAGDSPAAQLYRALGAVEVDALTQLTAA